VVPTNNKTRSCGITDIKESRIRKNLKRLTELTSDPRILQRTKDYIMAQTNSERQKAYRQRQKAEKKRLDLMITPEEMELFTIKAKEAGMTKAEYFSYLLNSSLK